MFIFASFLSACGGNANQSQAAAPQDNSAGIKGGSLAYVTEIDKTKIMTFEILADANDWQTMLDNATAEKYISADVTINGTTVSNVGIRPKGNSSLSSVARDDTSDRYSFKIKFDEYVEDQTWLGLDKIVLNNNYSDATSMKEYLSYDIMSYIGVDAPLFAYADITVNGESWGFYLAVEDVDSGYLERAKNDEGELYKPESMEMGGNMQNGPDGRGGGGQPPGIEGENRDGLPAGSPQAPNEGSNAREIPGNAGDRKGGGMRGADNGVALIYTDDNESSYSSIFDNAETKTNEGDHRRVIEAIKNLNEGTDLETYVDVDAVLRYLAAHTAVVNLDSYSGNMGHNYLLYENDGRISMIPWDYNMAFGGFQSAGASNVVNFPIDTPVSGVGMDERPLISKLFEVPEYLEKYHGYLQEIIDGYFADGLFEQKVDDLNALIAGRIENDPSAFYTYEKYQAAVTELKKLGALRAQSIQGQLDGTIPSTTDGQKAEPDKLTDASSLDMSAMGGGMGGEGDPRGFEPPEGMDMDVMRQAMEIIRSAQNSGLTGEQTARLHELGLTDEQIDQMQAQFSRGFDDRPRGGQ